jgi:hypothetical protein
MFAPTPGLPITVHPPVLLQSWSASFNVVAAAGIDNPIAAAASAAAIGSAMDMRICLAPW